MPRPRPRRWPRADSVSQDSDRSNPGSLRGFSCARRCARTPRVPEPCTLSVQFPQLNARESKMDGGVQLVFELGQFCGIFPNGGLAFIGQSRTEESVLQSRERSNVLKQRLCSPPRVATGVSEFAGRDARADSFVRRSG
jgi:hypothetical protein